MYVLKNLWVFVILLLILYSFIITHFCCCFFLDSIVVLNYLFYHIKCNWMTKNGALKSCQRFRISDETSGGCIQNFCLFTIITNIIKIIQFYFPSNFESFADLVIWLTEKRKVDSDTGMYNASRYYHFLSVYYQLFRLWIKNISSFRSIFMHRTLFITYYFYYLAYRWWIKYH